MTHPVRTNNGHWLYPRAEWEAEDNALAALWAEFGGQGYRHEAQTCGNPNEHDELVRDGDDLDPTWVCTRERGHTGNHVAHLDRGRVLAVWGTTPHYVTDFLPACVVVIEEEGGMDTDA